MAICCRLRWSLIGTGSFEGGSDKSRAESASDLLAKRDKFTCRLLSSGLTARECGQALMQPKTRRGVPLSMSHVHAWAIVPWKES